MAESGASRSLPSRWWAAAAGLAVVGIAWAAGAYGGGLSASTAATLEPASTPTTLPTGTLTTVEEPPQDAARIHDAESFWRAVGAGDQAGVLAALDPEAGTALAHYAGFAAGFGAGLEPEECRLTAPEAIRCMLRATNPDLIALAPDGLDPAEYVTSATVTFSDDGIDSMELPTLINTASLRLFAYAREHDGIPPQCDRIHYDAADLPPFNTTMAQTAECAAALLFLLPEALEPHRP